MQGIVKKQVLVKIQDRLQFMFNSILLSHFICQTCINKEL